MLLAAPAAQAGVWQASGSLVDVSVEVEGAAAPLYPARDGSGRYYLEARAGGRYAVRLANRTAERVGVVLAVDGLNAISGEREPGPRDRRGRAACTCSIPGTTAACAAGARRSRTCAGSPSWTSAAPTPPAPARRTARWAGSRSGSTASARRARLAAARAGPWDRRPSP